MIKLPELFEKKISTNPSLVADIRKNLDAFEPWLEQSGMPFFPGFTDHSPRHINDVLNTASALISDAGHNLLTAEDIAVLVTAILLHDCGMHLTHDGFRALISNTAAPLIQGLGDLPWSQLWTDFLGEAQRFSADRLQAVFGDSDPVKPGKIEIENLTERDCLLIGEFVRRHHARLAHEIAIVGVPFLGKPQLVLTGLATEIKDLAGLVARSHGMSIRATFTYLDKKYNRIPEQRRVKTPFLMAVLRIADYVQVQSERALQTLLSVKELRSPISRQEWRNHFSVSDVSMRHEDPEAMYVHATPTDVKTFLKLEALFKDIQHELDESWATIGEVYGRLGDLSQLGLTIRRIKSNLDAKEKFASSVTYVPIKAGFQSSGPDLLKLLVGPLYEYKFAVGIRELVQNAVDACREYHDLTGIPPNDENTIPDVLVEVQASEDGTGWVTFTDRGVGMTLETVTKYFLVAGASFRNSDIWKKNHTDQTGQVRVIRGGRFGVGALAAFLLGEEIYVKTRHFDREESSGIEFTARMDDPIVELRRCPAPAGTTIKVWISRPEVMKAIRPNKYLISTNSKQEAVQSLDTWDQVDWFAQSLPRVKFLWNGPLDNSLTETNVNAIGQVGLSTNTAKIYHLEFKSTNALVPSMDNDNMGWINLISPNPYKKILWKYSKVERKGNNDEPYFHLKNAGIVVNGMRVQTISEYKSIFYLDQPKQDNYEGPHYRIKRPSLAIVDPTGLCPINLQRDEVSFEKMNIDLLLEDSILSELIIQIQSISPSQKTIKNYIKFCKII